MGMSELDELAGAIASVRRNPRRCRLRRSRANPIWAILVFAILLACGIGIAGYALTRPYKPDRAQYIQWLTRSVHIYQHDAGGLTDIERAEYAALQKRIAEYEVDHPEEANR